MAKTGENSIVELKGFQVMDNGALEPPVVTAFSLDQGLMLQTLTVWADEVISGFEVTWTNGTTDSIGNRTGKMKSIQFDAGEKCKQASFFMPKVEPLFQGIRLVTNKQTFEHGSLSGTEVPQSVGSGLLAGVSSSAFFFGLIFLAPLKKIVSTVTYEDLPPGSTGITSMDLASYSYANDTNEDHDASWADSRTKTITYSWSQSATTVFGMSASISAGIPEVAETDVDVHWEISAETSHETTETEDRVLNWDYHMPVPPHTTINCVATTNYGTANIDYSASVSLEFLNGKKATYTENGTYNGVSYTRVVVHSTEDPN